MEIILYSDDINIINKWENAIKEKCRVCYDIDELSEVYDSIIILNYASLESDIKINLKKLNKNNNRVLIFQRNPSLKTAKELLKLGAKGYGNLIIKDHFIVSAIESIKDGMVWLHSEFTTMLLEDTNSNEEHKTTLDVLSKREKDVVYLLKDGISYKDIAKQLSVTPRTIKAHAHNIYKKLNVKDRFGLVVLLS